jgi:O-antigen/teichoic acid export membrane protein
LPLGTFSSLLVAMERYDILSGVTIVGELIRASLIVVLLKSGHGLIAVALVALLMSVAQYSTMAILAKSLHPALKLRIHFVDRAAFKELFGFGIYRFIWIVANQLIFYSDSVVIGIFVNAGAITYFAIAGTLINYGRTFVSLVTDTFYPAATRMDAKNDMDGLRELLILGTKITLLIALPLCIGFVFLGEQFITLWMGKTYASSAIFLVVLTIPQFTGLSQYVSALVLAGMAKHRILAFIVITEGVVNLLLSIILVRKMGLIGVAWGTVIPDVICTALIIPFYTLRILNLGVREYVTRAFLRPVLASLPIAALGYAFSRMVASVSWSLFGSEVAIICGVFAVLSYFLCLDTQQRAIVTGKLARLLNRQPVVHRA